MLPKENGMTEIKDTVEQFMARGGKVKKITKEDALKKYLANNPNRSHKGVPGVHFVPEDEKLNFIPENKQNKKTGKKDKPKS